MPGLNPASSSHSQSSAPIGDGKVTLPNAWRSFEVAELGTLAFPARPAVLSSTWEKFRAACGHRSTAYEAARADRRAVKATRADWLSDLRKQLSTYLGEEAFGLLPKAKGLSPEDGRLVRKLLSQRVHDLRSLPNGELQACITSFGKARNYSEQALRKVCDERYLKRTPSPTVEANHVNMVLYFLLQDMLQQPALASQVNAKAKRAALDAKNAQATPDAAALNRIRRDVLEEANREVSQALALDPGTSLSVIGLVMALEKALGKQGLLERPAELDAKSFRTPVQGVDFEAAKQHATEHLAGQQNFKDLEKAKQDAVLATLDKTLVQNLDKSSRTITPSKAVKLANTALKVYTAPTPNEKKAQQNQAPSPTRWNPFPKGQ